MCKISFCFCFQDVCLGLGRAVLFLHGLQQDDLLVMFKIEPLNSVNATWVERN